MEARHGATDLPDRRRARDRAGDGPRPGGGVSRRGRRRRGRGVQGDRGAARPVRAAAGTRHPDLRAGDPRCGDGRRDDRPAPDRGGDVLRLLRGVLGRGREPARQEPVHGRRAGELPARHPYRQRRRAAFRGPALAIGGELGDGRTGAEGRRAVQRGRRDRAVRGGGTRPRPGTVLRAQGALRKHIRGTRRGDRRHARHREGAPARRRPHHPRVGRDGAPRSGGGHQAGRSGHRVHRRRRTQPGAAGHRDDPARGVPYRPAVHGRGEPAAARLGRRDRIDHCRGVLLEARRAGGPDHQPAHPPAGRRCVGGSGDPVRGTDRRDDRYRDEVLSRATAKTAKRASQSGEQNYQTVFLSKLLTSVNGGPEAGSTLVDILAPGGTMNRRALIALMAAACLAVISAFSGLLGSSPAYAATTQQTFLTFYGWWDNTPPGNGISFPKIHSGAGGKGTFADPITFATAKAELAPGTKVWVPRVKKYFIMEDDCQECGADWSGHGPNGGPGLRHIDLWIGGKGGSAFDAIDCQDAPTHCQPGNTPTLEPVVVNPPSNEQFDSTPLLNTSTGACYGGAQPNKTIGQYKNGSNGPGPDDPHNQSTNGTQLK